MVESNQKLMSNETLERMQRSYLAMWVKMGADEDTKEDEQAAPAATVKTAWSGLGIFAFCRDTCFLLLCPLLLYCAFVLLYCAFVLLIDIFFLLLDPAVIMFPNKLGLPDWLHIGAYYCAFALFALLWVVAWRVVE